VSIWRSTKTDHELSVDSLVYRHSLRNSKHLVFNLVDNLFVGGFKNDSLYEKLKKSEHVVSGRGFKGCLASLQINGRMPDYDEIASIEDTFIGNITKGCESNFEKINFVILFILRRKLFPIRSNL
jgi:leucine-rich repeat transmembrane neuronal protein 1/2